jgi:hypothetical protein
MNRAPSSIMDMGGVLFKIGAIHTPEQQRVLEDKLNEAMKARRLTSQVPMRPARLRL